MRNNTLFRKLKRNIFYSFLGSLALSLFIVFAPSSVQSQGELGNYFALQYYKVHPSMENEFIRLEGEVWKKIHEARIKKDLLDGWYLLRVVAPSGTHAEYNYIIVFEYETAEKLTGHFEGHGINYAVLLDEQEIALALRAHEVRDMVYEEVWRTADQTFANSESQYRYQIFNSMKIKPGVDESEYVRLEKEYWKPVHTERIRRNAMFGWGLYTMIIPGGTERNYHWGTIDFYHNFKDYLVEESTSIMNSLYGPENAAKYVEETISKRDLLKAEIRELLDYMNDDGEN